MLSSSDKIKCLRSVEMFDGASESILEKLAEYAQEVTFEKGENLIVQGKRCGSLYFSIAGEFAVFLKDGDANRQIATLEGYGKVVGEIGAVSGLNATATVRVISEHAEFLELNGADFQRVVSVEPELASTVLRSLARYLSGR